MTFETLPPLHPSVVDALERLSRALANQTFRGPMTRPEFAERAEALIAIVCGMLLSGGMSTDQLRAACEAVLARLDAAFGAEALAKA